MDQTTIAENANVNRKIIRLVEILLHQLSPSAIWLVLKKFGQYGLPTPKWNKRKQGRGFRVATGGPGPCQWTKI